MRLQAGGLGLNLTAPATASITASASAWATTCRALPGCIASDSGARPLCHLTAARTIDEIIADALADKEDVIQRILNTRDLTSGSRTRSSAGENPDVIRKRSNENDHQTGTLGQFPGANPAAPLEELVRRGIELRRENRDLKARTEQNSAELNQIARASSSSSASAGSGARSW